MCAVHHETKKKFCFFFHLILLCKNYEITILNTYFDYNPDLINITKLKKIVKPGISNNHHVQRESNKKEGKHMHIA